MRKLLFCLLLICSFIKGFGQSFPAYYEPFTDSVTRQSDIVFGGSPNPAFLTANPKKDVKDAQGKGFLRLTSRDFNQKGYIYSKTKFSSSQGFSIQFEYFTYNGSGNADGITFFLFDAAAESNFSLGGFGGSLGYAPYKDGNGTTAGLKGGYIGIGIDEYGNFKMKKEGRNSGIEEVQLYQAPPPHSITIRANEASDYFMEKNVQTLTDFGFKIGTGVERANDQSKEGYRKCFIDLEVINGNANNGYYITVKILEGGAIQKVHTVIDKHEYKYAPPAFLMYGIASSTGLETNIHEIRNLRINSFDLDPEILPVALDDNGGTVYAKKTAEIDVLNNDVAEVNHTIPKDQVFLNQTTSVKGGTLVVDPLTGKIKYTAPENYSGADSFVYYVKDDRGLQSNLATVTLNIKALPVGVADFPRVVWGETLSKFSVKSNDGKDTVGATFKIKTYPAVTLSSPGNFIWHGDGTFTYKPVDGPFSDSFKYVIVDAGGQESEPIEVSVKILYKPVTLRPKYFYITTNTQEALHVAKGDYDKDTGLSDDKLWGTAEVVQQPKHATGDSKFLPETGGHYIYTSTKGITGEDFIGIDQFTYKIQDETIIDPYDPSKHLESDPQNVYVYVYPKPRIGIAKSAFVKEAENSSYDITYKFYIKNLNPVLPQFSSSEQMVLTKVGILDDVSKAFGGYDYTIKETPRILGKSGTLYANPAFTGKKLNAQDFESIQLLNQTVSKLAPGVSDTIQFVVNVKFDRSISWPISNIATASGTFELLSFDTFRTDRDDSYNGVDPNDDVQDGPTSVLLEVPEKPETKEIIITRYTDEPPLLFEVINDYVIAKGGKSIDRSSLAIKKLSGTNVEFSIETDQKVKFSQNGTTGITRFSYTVRDELGVLSDVKTITVEVKPIPTGNPDVFYTLTNKQIDDLNILKNDGTTVVTNTYDIELDPTFTGLTPNSVHGSYTYTPPTDQHGDFTFQYKLKFYSNPGKTSAPITVKIHVNDPPTATDANLKTGMNTPLSIDIAGRATDVDGTINRSSVKLQNVDLKGGELVEDPNSPGVFLFTPKTNFSGSVQFLYTVDDSDPNIVGTSQQKLIVIQVEQGVVVVTPTNKIGLSKHMAGISAGLNGTYDVKYVFTIKNYGQERLNNISLTDDLGLAFQNTQFLIKSFSADGTLSVNNAFNGFATIEILDKASSYLLPGTSAKVELVVNVKLLEKEGVFINTAFVEADPAGSSTKARDQSTSGTSPDPAGDGDVSPKDPTFVELLFPRLFIPGGFSPNNDGTNDLFVIRNAKNSKIAMEIFNRWGNRVHKSADYQNDWDGKCTEGISLGQELPPGTYFYIIILDGKDKYTGYITLNR